MSGSLTGKLYRLLGLNVRANRADALKEEGRLLIAEHRKPENARPRKVGFEEIMGDLATGTPGRFLDRKIQAYISGDLWPPTTMTETFDKVEADGHDNAWTLSVQGVEKLIILAHPSVFETISLGVSPHRATFEVDGRRYSVAGKTAAMALMGVHLTAGRIRYGSNDTLIDLGSFVTTLS